ncbi:hypothetical protein ABK040_001531 [Willaertia magna]
MENLLNIEKQQFEIGGFNEFNLFTNLNTNFNYNIPEEENKEENKEENDEENIYKIKIKEILNNLNNKYKEYTKNKLFKNLIKIKNLNLNLKESNNNILNLILDLIDFYVNSNISKNNMNNLINIINIYFENILLFKIDNIKILIKNLINENLNFNYYCKNCNFFICSNFCENYNNNLTNLIINNSIKNNLIKLINIIEYNNLQYLLKYPKTRTKINRIVNNILDEI